MTLEDYEGLAARLSAAHAGWCADLSPRLPGRARYVCSRPHGHPGAHEARSSTGYLYASWECTHASGEDAA